jgi:1-phosphofructokinase
MRSFADTPAELCRNALPAMVFTPTPLLTVTIERRSDGHDDVHLHAGGQGVWIARMMSNLGLDVVLCAPLGGETGEVIRSILCNDGLDVLGGGTTQSGSYVHDRRDGERLHIASSPPSPLSRHEFDELYDVALVEGLEADVAVLAGPDAEDVIAPSAYGRLAHDLRGAGICVVADLSGDSMRAAAEAGVSLLKVSHENLVRDADADNAGEDALLDAMRELLDSKTDAVVLSRANEPTLALDANGLVEVSMTEFAELDRHGAGDSMTAAMATALARGAKFEDALKLGAAAGALNVTRHGLATGQRELIERLSQHVELRRRG